MIDLIGIYHHSSQKCQITGMSSSCSEVLELSGEFGFSVYTLLQNPEKVSKESKTAALLLDLLKSSKTFSENLAELERIAQNAGSSIKIFNAQEEAHDEDALEAYAWEDFDNIYLT